jgi:hypothetical protein
MRALIKKFYRAHIACARGMMCSWVALVGSFYVDGNLVLAGYTGNTSYTGNWRPCWGTQNDGLGFFNEVQLQRDKDIV